MLVLLAKHQKRSKQASKHSKMPRVQLELDKGIWPLTQTERGKALWYGCRERAKQESHMRT